LLVGKIESAGAWTHPIPVESKTYLVTDGNHRLSAARRIGLKYIPVFLLDYDSQNVKVYHNDQTQGLFDISTLLNIPRNGETLPFKSTKHFFLPILPVCNIDIKKLK